MTSSSLLAQSTVQNLARYAETISHANPGYPTNKAAYESENEKTESEIQISHECDEPVLMQRANHP
jgi:hypothetical protein